MGKPFSRRNPSWFWDKVNVTDTCWLWTANKSVDGYGLIYTCVNGKESSIGAHRFMYQFAAGLVPAGLEVLHLCHTPACVRPDHLEVGDHARNMKQMVESGRANRVVEWTRGEGNGMAKLTNLQAAEIIDKRAKGIKPKKLAEFYGVSEGTIYKILRGVTYRR